VNGVRDDRENVRVPWRAKWRLLNDVLNSLGVDSAPRKGRIFIGFIGVFGFFLVGKADLRFFVTAAPCATHVLFSSARCSALERVIVERGSSRKIYEPTVRNRRSKGKRDSHGATISSINRWCFCASTSQGCTSSV
jgi:hypothetical protein